MDLTTHYLGMKLAHPVVAASSGLTGSMDGIRTLEKNGVSAVVLKSIFEEEILMEAVPFPGKDRSKNSVQSDLKEIAGFIDLQLREEKLNEYLDLISEAKRELSIPVIGSINCTSHEDWTYFTGKIEKAGADALELNLFLHPADLEGKDFERVLFRVIEQVLAEVRIPVSIKISRYFTRLGLTIKALSETGIAGIVLFNRFYTPDIDIEKMTLVNGKMFSSSEEVNETLRWIAIMAERVACDLAASTGIHTGEEVIKALLAGARVTQVASTLYRNGPDQVGRILKKLEHWMRNNGFSSLDQFRGKVAGEYRQNPAAFERMQFMKHYGNYS